MELKSPTIETPALDAPDGPPGVMAATMQLIRWVAEERATRRREQEAATQQAE